MVLNNHNCASVKVRKFFSSFFRSLKIENQVADTIVNNARKITWHKTLTQCSNVPSNESLHLAGRRFQFVIKTISRATDLKIHHLDIYEYGWEKCPTSGEPVPIWDSIQKIENI